MDLPGARQNARAWVSYRRYTNTAAIVRRGPSSAPSWCRLLAPSAPCTGEPLMMAAGPHRPVPFEQPGREIWEVGAVAVSLPLGKQTGNNTGAGEMRKFGCGVSSRSDTSPVAYLGQSCVCGFLPLIYIFRRSEPIAAHECCEGRLVPCCTTLAQVADGSLAHQVSTVCS